MISKETKLMAGAIIITIPTIIYGGTFLLSILSGEQEQLKLTEFQYAMFRAGHAHAGVIVILSLLVQIFADHARLSHLLNWAVRFGVPLSAIFISGGFFGGGAQANEPGPLIAFLWVGVFMLVVSLLILGIGLLRSTKKP